MWAPNKDSTKYLSPCKMRLKCIVLFRGFIEPLLCCLNLRFIQPFSFSLISIIVMLADKTRPFNFRFKWTVLFLSLILFHLIHLPPTMIPTGHPSAAIAFRRIVPTYTPQGIIYLLSSLSEFWIFRSYANIEPLEVPFHYQGVTSIVKKMPYKYIFWLVDNSLCFQNWSTFLDTGIGW